jgi:F-box and leucine-rich repeat protein 1 (S-phase kinase-associated protein 2)
MDSSHSTKPLRGELNNLLGTLMVYSGVQSRQAQNVGTETSLTGWKDLPMELLLRIMSLVGDDRMVIVASGVCTGWRDTLGWGVANLSLSW